MIELQVREILEATGGFLAQGQENQTVKNIASDSRKIEPGDLFVALNGKNFKGADFVEEALSKGAVGFIAQKSKIKYQKSNISIQVDDPLKALQGFAHYILNKVKPKVIGITGSTGKTGVREMLKSILSLKYEVIASKDNFNNEVGLPLTLLELKPSTQIVILEMAMRGLGQIRELCRIAPPDFAIITNVGLAHIELLESKENIIKAKAEIIEGLKKGGTVFLNSDDEATRKLRMANDELRMKKKDVLTFGSDMKGDVYFANVSFDHLARPTFILKFEIRNSKFEIPINLSIPGQHQVANACAAAAAALNLGLSLADIKKGLESLMPIPGRMNIVRVKDWIIVDDSYNASPASMTAAVNVLKEIKGGRKIAILGDMLELGDTGLKEHKKLGRLVARSGIDMLLTVGKLARYIGQAAIEAGMASDNIHNFTDCSDLKKEIISYLKPGDAILTKASRAIELDNIAHYLQKKR